MIYLHSSALMKLVLNGEETTALEAWLRTRSDQAVATSQLGRIEVLRAASRASARVSARARALVGDVELVPLDPAVQDLACVIGGPWLRTLDALHLASAVLLGDALTVFVVYDIRLVDAARAAGLVVATPRR